MQVFVYRSGRKEGAYVYLAKRDDFSALPAMMLQSLGDLQFALEFELGPERKLAIEDASEVKQHLQTRGFHIQMPPAVTADPMTDDWSSDV